ncbi:MAG: hypothetical protein KJO82_09525 [Gammaproteobacteria bacterium]|nr:hypothetical protein [Gammaproteobacteria bacterium]
MKKLSVALVSGAVFLYSGLSLADGHEGAEEQSEPAMPVELYACNYADGKEPADLDRVVANWNKWADKEGINDYTAWTLTPFYAGPEQDFDLLWLGISPSATAMGRAQDMWLANGGKIQAQFDEVIPCQAHANFAALAFKAPPEREDTSTLVISFSDCRLADGADFGDVGPALTEWGKYREGHGSTSGIWVMFPAYGAGGEEFDFKYIAAWQNLEDQGADWDQYAAAGWEKAEELFAGKMDCDASRVYIAAKRRDAAESDD